MPYKLDDEEKITYLLLPKVLFSDEHFTAMSLAAKVMYSVLRDRMHLSKKNGWAEKDRTVYFLFSQDELAQILNIDRSTVSRAMKDLKEHALIETKRQGMGLPNKIYLYKIDEALGILEDTLPRYTLAHQDVAKCNNRCGKMQLLDVAKCNSNNTNNNYTENRESRYPLSDSLKSTSGTSKGNYRGLVGSDRPLKVEKMPTVEEVKQFFLDNHLVNSNPEKFYAWFSDPAGGGWPKDWQRRARKWNADERHPSGTEKAPVTEYTDEEQKAISKELIARFS